MFLFPDMLKVAENGGSGAGKHCAPELQDQDKGWSVKVTAGRLQLLETLGSSGQMRQNMLRLTHLLSTPS